MTTEQRKIWRDAIRKGDDKTLQALIHALCEATKVQPEPKK